MGRFRSLVDLEQYMKGLANENRLSLLEKLGRPGVPDALHLTPSVSDGRGRSGRPIAKQAVRRHVRTLSELGLLVELEEKSGVSSGASRYCVDLPKLFLFLEDLRGHLGSLQGDEAPWDPEVLGVRVPRDSFLPQNGSTRTLRLPHEPALEDDGPRLVVVRGLREGQVVPLDSEEGEGRSSIGRSPECEVRLEYDPYLAPVQAHVEGDDGGFRLVDEPGSANPTVHNWEALEDGGSVRLRDGDMVGVGRSLLLFRD
jgi:hypothetical protein